MKIRIGKLGGLLSLVLALFNLAASVQPIDTTYPFPASATDFAINGTGWFVLRDPINGVEMFTRYGNFFVDGSGFLVTSEGFRVQGYNDSTLTNRGDIHVDSDVAAVLVSYRFETNGVLRVQLDDGSDRVRGQVLLQQFRAPQKLTRISLHLLYGDALALPLPAPLPPGSSGLGTLQIGALNLEPTAPLLTVLPDARRAGALAEGVITRTQNNADLGIHGPGCFLLRDPQTSELSATRVGFFLVDRDGYVITADNQRLQGITNMVEIFLGGAGGVGDLNIQQNPIGSTARATGFAFQRNGEVAVRFSNGSQYSLGKILLYDFRKPTRLRPAALGRLKNVAPAQPFALEGVGGWAPGGTRLEPGLELINVTPDLLKLRRQFSFFVQGYIEHTGVATQLALNGNGFFRLRDPLNGRIWASRNGNFHIDANGLLLNARGWRVQGFSDAALSEVGDIKFDLEGAPAGTTAVISSFGFDRQGRLTLRLSDGTTFVRAQVLVQSFREPFRLTPIGIGLYGNVDAAGPLTFESPGINGNGTLAVAALEILEPREVLALPSRDGFRFSISGEPGSRWVVQARENLRSWQTIGVISHAPFEAEFCDRSSGRHPPRFYRVVGAYPPGDFAELMPQSNLLRATYH